MHSTKNGSPEGRPTTVQVEDLMRRSRFNFKGMKYKLPHTKHSIMAGTFLTHQIDEQAVSNLLEVTSSGRKLPLEELELYNRTRCDVFKRSAGRPKRHDFLRFRIGSKERAQMQRKHCHSIAAVISMVGGETTPTGELVKNVMSSLEKRKIIPSEERRRHRRFHSSLQEVKGNLFEIPLPKEYRVQTSHSFYYAQRYKTLDDCAQSQMDLYVRSGQCPRTLELDSVEDGYEKCPDNTHYSNEFYPRRTSTSMKFHRRATNYLKKKEDQRCDCIQLGVTEMKLHEKQKPPKLGVNSRKLQDSRPLQHERSRSQSIACGKMVRARPSREYSDRYLSPWLDAAEDQPQF